MDQPGTSFGIAGHEFEIIAVSGGCLWFFLRVQAMGRSPAGFRTIWLNFQRVPESCFRFFRVSFTKRAPPEVIDGRNVVWIQMQQRLEGLRGAGSITRAVLRHCQQISGTAL